MIRRLLWLGVCGGLFVCPALATQPGERLSADDLVFTIFGLEAGTFVPVDPEFDYSGCASFPTPADLRCDLLAQNGFDAEGRQYATRISNSIVNPLLARTEIWRTRPDGTTEMIAYLEPRSFHAGAFDDGRIERIAVDTVTGTIFGVLSTSCFPTGSLSCLYSGRTNEIVKITGLKTLRDVLLTGTQFNIGAGGGSKLPIGQTTFSNSPGGPGNRRTSSAGDHP